MAMKFTDDSFVVFYIEDITEGYGYKQECISIKEYSIDNSDSLLLDLELITEKEHRIAVKKDEEDREISYQKYLKEQNDFLNKKN